MKLQSKVIKVKQLTDSVFYIRFTRENFSFQAGQYVLLSFPGSSESREYSLSGGEHDPWLEVLVKEIPAGSFSLKLKQLKKGDMIQVEGPYGFFILHEQELETKEFVFVATGTGIAPFKSFVRSNPSLDYHLVHGVRIFEDNCGKNYFPILRRTICTSRDQTGNYTGRVTQYLKSEEIDQYKIYYLCGNSKMIDEVSEILENGGVPVKNIRSEVFF